MGIKNLSKFLRDTCPFVYEDVKLSEYAFEKIAIDISLFMHKFKAIAGKDWLRAFVNLVKCLRQNEIHCVMIYDGKAPPDKDEERKSRSDNRDKLRERVETYEIALDNYYSTGEVDACLMQLYTQKRPISLLKPPSTRDEGGERRFNIVVVEEAIEKMKDQIITVTPEDFQLTRDLFDILDVPYIQAEGEAETLCADLCIRGEVAAVLSEDTDVLAYGAPVFLCKIDTAQGVCKRVRKEVLLPSLNLSPSAFLDFCIMCGTDYNKNIPKIGCKTAYRYILAHDSIEEVEEKLRLDISILKHTRVRELFTDYPKQTVELRYCGRPSFDRLGVFLFENNVRMDDASLRKAFLHNSRLVFEE